MGRLGKRKRMRADSNWNAYKIQTATNFGWVVALIAMFIQKRKNFPFKTHGVSLRRHVFSTKASAMQRKMVRYRTFILPPMT